MTTSCTLCKTGTRSIKKINKLEVAHSRIFPYSLKFFLEGAKADADVSYRSLALSGTIPSNLSRHWRPSSHPGRALIRAGAENVVVSRRGHQ